MSKFNAFIVVLVAVGFLAVCSPAWAHAHRHYAHRSYSYAHPYHQHHRNLGVHGNPYYSGYGPGYYGSGYYGGPYYGAPYYGRPYSGPGLTFSFGGHPDYYHRW
jgi:hypothetical protein